MQHKRSCRVQKRTCLEISTGACGGFVQLNLLASCTTPLLLQDLRPPSLFVFPGSLYLTPTRGAGGLPTCETSSPAVASCVKLKLDEYDSVYHVVQVSHGTVGMPAAGHGSTCYHAVNPRVEDTPRGTSSSIRNVAHEPQAFVGMRFDLFLGGDICKVL